MGYTTFKIPKKTRGEFRTVYAPDKELLQKQRSMLPALEKEYLKLEEAFDLVNIAHGFLHKRSAITGAKAHIGFDTTIMLDITDFFDSVTHEMVEWVRRKINSITVIPTECFVGEPGNLRLAQGYATSPLLGNIAILPVMKRIKRELVETFIPSMENYSLTIYADDICVSYNTINIGTSVEDQVNMVELMVSKALEQYGFTLNPKKTRVRQAKYGYRRILGINVGDDHIRATRKVMRKLRASRHQHNGPSLGGLTNWKNQSTSKEQE